MKLLILCERETSAAMEESALSWPKRELGAEIDYYHSHSIRLGVKLATWQGVVVYRSTLNPEAKFDPKVLRVLRKSVRLVHWCSEAPRPDYAAMLAEYTQQECFDFTVGT